MQEKLKLFLQENIEYVFLFSLLFLFIFFIKSRRKHYIDKSKIFDKTLKEKIYYYYITNFIDYYYHVIPYIYVFQNVENIEELSIELYKKYSTNLQPNVIFFVIAIDQRLIRINLGEDIKFLVSLNKAEELLDKMIENVCFTNFITVIQEIKELCKENLKKGTIKSTIFHLIPLSLFFLYRGFFQEKFIDASGNEDTFINDNIYEKCIGITKSF